ncbi:DnaB-like helicase C-terminal domain-containing protein [Novosphingobium sp.]|uniref:DnaB-like helicase C-terminal domain-containing protein n=1 Tax=Novosphingobium sp. TaxID=1874826 RepID=UPI003B51CFF4
MASEDLAILDHGEILALSRWNITQATARHWDYRVRVNPKGEGEHLATVRDEHGSIVGAHVRNVGKDGEDKQFRWLGDDKAVGLYGLHLMGNGGKMIVVCEGAKDTLTASQLWANKFPVVGIIHGVQTAKKNIARYLDRLSKFDKVVFAFDMDEPGRTACVDCAKLLPAGKAFIATLPYKDINEMHMAGQDAALIAALHNAAPYRPDGITTLADLAGEMLSPTVTGRAYPFRFLTDWTYGRRDGEVLVLAAGTGVGKSDLSVQIAAHNIETQERGGNFLPTAIFNYEAGPQVTGKQVAGKLIQRRLHIPDPEDIYWSEAELREAVRYATTECAKLFINDHQGATDWGSVKERIRFLAHTEGIKDAFVDPMAALVATEEDERKALDRLMAEAKMLAEELKIGLWFNTHVTRPSEGKSHEEGGRVTLKHLRGSNAIGMWASYVFALERDQQGDEDARSLTTLRCLKDRFTGDSTGKTQVLRYNTLTGMLEVAVSMLDEEADLEAPPL